MSGSGNLDAYALVSKEVFTTKLPAMARIQFDDLKSLDSFSQVYQKRLEAHQEELEKLLKDNGKARYQRLKQEADGRFKKARKNSVVPRKHSSQPRVRSIRLNSN